MHPLDLMNDVPSNGHIPPEIVALAKGCICRGDSHDPDSGCRFGEPMAVDVEAYRKLRDEHAELVKALTAVVDEPPLVGRLRALGVLCSLGLRA